MKAIIQLLLIMILACGSPLPSAACGCNLDLDLEEALQTKSPLLYDRLGKSDAVIVGHVQSSRSFWSNDSSIILTEFSVRADRHLMGQPCSIYSVIVEGGEIGDIGLMVSGESVLEVGTDYVMLIRIDNGVAGIVGRASGVQQVDIQSDYDRNLIESLAGAVAELRKEIKK